jgi:2-polyprenyl-6-methoxyphenol hydroxylase-like FAD-dependent oxidoreductase
MFLQPDFDPRYDVIVVGARPAGAATAMLLARRGFKVLVVDRQAYGSDTLSTHALMRGAVAQLRRWGLLDEIVAAGTPAIRRTTFHYGDEAIAVDIKPDGSVDALYAPRRTVLDRILVDGARAAGADVRHGATLTALNFAPDHRVVGGTIRDRDGSVHDVAADLMIGADGRHSTVARLVGARSYRRSGQRTATVYGFFSGLENRGYRWFYRPGVSAGVIPTNDGESCVFASLPPGRFARAISGGPVRVFDTILAEISVKLDEEIKVARQQGRFHGFPGEPAYFRQSFGPGWALVGDAGYFKDSLTAHGITDALRDAELLARAVADGRPRAFQRYQKERDALSMELFETTQAVASFDWSMETIKQHHRRLNKAMKAENAALAALAAPMALAA